MSDFVFVSEKDLVPLQKRPEVDSTFYQRCGADGFRHLRVTSHLPASSDLVVARAVGQKAGTESVVGWTIGAYGITKTKI